MNRLQRLPPAPRRVPLALALALALLVGCGGTSAPPVDTSSPDEARQGLEVRSATVQWMPGMSMAAVYLEVVDHDGLGDRLLRVETEMASAAETHESLADGDTVRMVARPEGFEVPAAGTLRLAPGGKHIMLVEPRPPADGSPFPLILVFERAGSLAIEAELLGGTMDHGTMDHGAMDHGAMDHGAMDHGAMAHDTTGHEGMDMGEGSESGATAEPPPAGAEPDPSGKSGGGAR